MFLTELAQQVWLWNINCDQEAIGTIVDRVAPVEWSGALFVVSLANVVKVAN